MKLLCNTAADTFVSFDFRWQQGEEAAARVDVVFKFPSSSVLTSHFTSPVMFFVVFNHPLQRLRVLGRALTGQKLTRIRLQNLAFLCYLWPLCFFTQGGDVG